MGRSYRGQPFGVFFIRDQVMVKLSVNVDHVATVRQARRALEPDPVEAAFLAELGGAHGITVHLREDRRHIQDRDLRLLRKTVKTKLNLEMAADKKIVEIALEVRPDQITLVPERREEVTTEGGLDLLTHKKKLARVVRLFREEGIPVSLFVDPVPLQVEAAVSLGAPLIEINTGRYSQSRTPKELRRELGKVLGAAELALGKGLILNAGHGLNYRNVGEISRIPGMNELNIGHSIVSRAILVGLTRAVRQMLALL